MIENRRYIILFVFLLVAFIYLGKLFSIQVLEDKYKLAAEDNTRRRKVEYPFRGLIYDRNMEVIVYNEPVYDLMFIPKEIKGMDTLAFCQSLSISKEEFLENIQNAKSSKGYSYHKPNPFIKQLSNEEFARIQDLLVDYPGFYTVARTVRSYPNKMMANALGYIGEVSNGQIKKNPYYKSGDYIGRSGLESYYEKELRGKRGVKYSSVNVRGIEKGPYKGGQYDTLSIPGANLVSTIDTDLQLYGEKLMKGKLGSIVAVEPATGEVLSIVSGPSYDPNDFSGRNFSENYTRLKNDTTKPLFNRPLMAMYPPGSIWKLAQALIGLQEGVITPSTRIYCNRAIIKCHGAHTNDDLQGAIAHSCNPYFYNVMNRVVNRDLVLDPYEDTKIGYNKWREYVRSFGFGAPLGIDLPNEKGGYIPTEEYYNRIYGERGWKYKTIYSLSIGQGEILTGPLQMVNMAATLANRGYYITPHVVKAIGEDGQPLPKFQEKHLTKINREHFGVVIDAMERVINEGTGFRAGVPGVEVCGKTGTVQNPHGEDHSVFIAFAPKENPKIAVSVYVENSGQGARAAASIAGLMIEKYLKREEARLRWEEYVLKGEFIY